MMAVRFFPTDGHASVERGPEREDLAEVIEFRSRLRQAPTGELHGELSGTRDDAEIVVLSARQNDEAELRLAAIEQADDADSSTFADGLADAGKHLGTHSAHDDAVRLLARRARSSGELRRELAAQGHSSADVEAVVLQCETDLYLDDVGLARVLTEGLRDRKRASRAQIRMKLRDRLLPDGVIEQALSELNDEEEHELLRQAANDRAHKMRGLDRQTAERRLLGFLARRGWSGERAIRVAREALDSTAARGTVRFR